MKKNPITAHKKLHPTIIGAYTRGWEIMQENERGQLVVLKTVNTKKEAKLIVGAQNINANEKHNS